MLQVKKANSAKRVLSAIPRMLGSLWVLGFAISTLAFPGQEPRDHSVLASVLGAFSPSAQADEHSGSDDGEGDEKIKFVRIENLSTAGGIPQKSGASSTLTGQIHVDGHFKKNIDLVALLKKRGYIPEGFFPDGATRVTADISFKTIDRNTIQFQYTTPVLAPAPGVFTLQISHDTDDILEMQAILAKIDIRAKLFTALILKLQGQPDVDPEDLADLIRIRDGLLALSTRIGQWIGSQPQVISLARFPLQVDNNIAGSSLNSYVQKHSRLSISYDVGSAIQGERVKIHYSILNLEKPNLDLEEERVLQAGEISDDLRQAQFSWQGAVVKTVGPQTLAPGQELAFDLFTPSRLQPADLNTAQIAFSEVDTEDDGGETEIHALGSIALVEPVAGDAVAPVWLAGSSFERQPSCGLAALLVDATVGDSFGLVDGAVNSAQLICNFNDGTNLSRDVSAVLGNASVGQVLSSNQAAQGYRFSGDLNSLVTKDGICTIQAQAADLALNHAVPFPITTTFRRDTVAPVTTLAVADSVYTNKPYTNIPNLNFGVNVLDYFDRCSIQTQVTDNGALFAQSTAPSFTVSGHLSDGFHQFSATSQNLSNGLAGAATGFSIIVDTVSPTLSEISPSNGAIINTLSFPVKFQASEKMLSATLNGSPMTLSADGLSATGTFNAPSEGFYTLQLQASDLATNVTSANVTVQVLLRALNGDLLSVVPAQDGTHLIIKGAAGATRPGLTVDANGGFLNTGSATGGKDGSFVIPLFGFSEATLTACDPSLGRCDSAVVHWGNSAGTSLAGLVTDSGDPSSNPPVPPRPLAGATVSLVGTTVPAVQTQADGTFRFPQPVTGDQTLLVDGTTIPQLPSPAPARRFSKAALRVNIGLTMSNVLPRAIVLTPTLLDGSATTISAASGGMVTNVHAPGVTLMVPAGAAKFPDGSVSSPISMTTIPAHLTTVQVPKFSVPKTVVALEPSGTTFSTPVEVSLPNANHLPVGTDLVIMSQNSATGLYEIDGVASVASDSVVRTKPGMGITHFSSIYASPIGPTVRQIGGADQPGANTFDGALTRVIKMPSYKALGQDVTPTLLYKSSWAKPSTLVNNLFDIPRHEVSLDRDIHQQATIHVPVCIVFCFDKDVDVYVDASIRGRAWYQPDYITAQFFAAGIVSPLMTFTGVPNRAEISYAIDMKDPATLDYLPSGIYPYLSHYEVHMEHVTVGTQTVTSWSSVDSTPQIQTTSLDKVDPINQAFPQDLGGPIFVENEVHSSAGQGWKIGGVQKIANPSDNEVMIEEADGSISSFDVNNTIETLYTANPAQVDLTLGSDINHWPNAWVTQPGGAGISLLKLTGNPPNPQSQGAMFGAGGLLQGGVFLNKDIANLPWISAAWYFWQYYSINSLPQQLALLSTGTVVGTDIGREVVFYLSNGTTQVAAGSFGSPIPTFGNSSYFYCHGDTGYHGGECYSGNGEPWGGYQGFKDPYIAWMNAYCTALPNVTCGGTNVPPEQQAYGFQVYNQIYSSGVVPIAALGDNSLNTHFNYPMGIIAGPRPNTAVVADTGNNMVRLIDFNNGTVSILAGNGNWGDYGDGGPATQAALFHPRGVVYDAMGNLYISTENGLIRKVDTTGMITTFAGTVSGGQYVQAIPAKQASFRLPYGMAVDNQNGYLYVADTGHYRVVRVDFLTQTATQVAGTNGPGDSIDGQPALAGGLNNPLFVALDDKLNLLIVDSVNQKIKRVNFQSATNGSLVFAQASSIRPGVRKNPNGSWVPALQRNADGSWTRNYRNGGIVYFDAHGSETDAVDRVGNLTHFDYDGNGNLIRITDPTHRSIHYSYTMGRLTSIDDDAHPGSPGTRLSYDAGGTLTLVTYPDNTTHQFGYRSDGLMTSETDATLHSTAYTYNEWNRLTNTSHDSGVSLGIADSGSKTVANTAVGGAPAPLQPVGTEAGGVQDTVTDPNGNPISIAKDARGYAGATTDADGKSTQIVRNLEGKPVKITRPDGTIEAFTYESTYGDLIQHSDTATGITTYQSFDDFGNLTSVTNGRGFTYTTQYDPHGLILAKVDPLGQSNPVGHQTTYTYNAQGQVLSSTNPVGLSRTLTYDTAGNVLTTSVGAKIRSTLTYDTAGNVKTSQDANGSLTVFEYDFFNRLTAVTSPKFERTEYTYRATGELSMIKDASGNLTHFEYDSLGRMVKKTDPIGMVTLRGYDSNGNITSELDPNGNLKRYRYNAKNQLILKTLPDNVVSLQYDDRKNLAQAKDNETEIDFGYDMGGRLVSAQTQGFGALASLPSVTLTFGRDENGNRTSMTDPLKSTAYSFDPLDRLSGFTVADRASGASRSYGFAYDNASRLTSITRPGSQTTLTFDGQGFLQSMIHGTGSSTITSLTLMRDGNGNITQVTDNASRILRSIAYDPDNQVTSATNAEATGSKSVETFSYDSSYNRISDQEGNYHYQQNPGQKNTDRLVEDYRYFYYFDNNGNLTSRQSKAFNGEVTNYWYSSENQLLGFKVYVPGSQSFDPSHLWTPTSVPVKEVRYSYDAIGRRVKKEIVDFTSQTDPTKTFTRQYLYDGHEILVEYDGSGAALAHFTHSTLGSDDVMAVEVTSGGAREQLAQSAGVYSYLKNSLGSISDVVDTSGQLVQHYVYSTYGTVLRIQNGAGTDVTATPPLRTSYGFTGREIDSESGMMYYRARYYDPSIGRFLQKDPEPGKLNVPISVVNGYAYVANNPINLADPTGRSIWSDLGGLIVNTLAFPVMLMILPVAALIDPSWALGNLMKSFNLSIVGEVVNLGATGVQSLVAGKGFDPRWARESSFMGRTTVENSMFAGGVGFTAGPVSFLQPDAPLETKYHEIGHQLQYEKYGGWGFFIRGAESLWEEKVSGSGSYDTPFECEAGTLSHNSFGLTYYPDTGYACPGR